VDWLYKTNVKLATFIREPHFEKDLLLWKFEDECRYIHLELMDLREKSGEN